MRLMYACRHDVPCVVLILLICECIFIHTLIFACMYINTLLHSYTYTDL